MQNGRGFRGENRQGSAERSVGISRLLDHPFLPLVHTHRSRYRQPSRVSTFCPIPSHSALSTADARPTSGPRKPGDQASEGGQYNRPRDMCLARPQDAGIGKRGWGGGDSDMERGAGVRIVSTCGSSSGTSRAGLRYNTDREGARQQSGAGSVAHEPRMMTQRFLRTLSKSLHETKRSPLNDQFLGDFASMSHVSRRICRGSRNQDWSPRIARLYPLGSRARCWNPPKISRGHFSVETVSKENEFWRSNGQVLGHSIAH
jgi:hypothetical protein